MPSKAFEVYPHPIPVSFPREGYVDHEGGTYGVPCVTDIFRRGLELPEFALTVKDRFTDKEQVNVMSIGCSVGAEVFAMAALLQHLRVSSVSLLGLDIRPDVIEIAKTGVLTTPKIHGENARRLARKTLETYGFGIEQTKEVMYQAGEEWHGIKIDDEPPVPADVHTIDSRMVTDGYNVEFRVHNPAVQGPVKDFRPDAVLINNLLYQVPQNVYTKILEGVAETMNRDGVMCINGGFFEPLGDGIERNYSRRLERYQAEHLFRQIPVPRV